MNKVNETKKMNLPLEEPHENDPTQIASLREKYKKLLSLNKDGAPQIFSLRDVS